MNKLIKGAIAGSAGLALLLSGAGTFAVWTSKVTAAPEVISAGKLTLAIDDAPGTWENITSGVGTVIDPATFRIVPGNTLTYTRTLTINAVGDDLVADLTYDMGSIDGGITGLSSVLTMTPTANATADGNTVKVLTEGTVTVDAVLTLTMPDTVKGGQNLSADLGDITFTLTQVAPPTA